MTNTQRPTTSELIATLKASIESNKYRTLQATLKALRGWDLYNGALNLKTEELKAEALEILAKLEAKAAKDATIAPHGDETEDQILYHRQFLTPQNVPAIVKKWLDNKDKGGIVAVLDAATGLYMTYASHARALARIRDWESMSVEDGITLISLDPRYTWHTANILERRDLSLTLID